MNDQLTSVLLYMGLVLVVLSLYRRKSFTLLYCTMNHKWRANAI